jgi:hypothetical protein
MTKVTSMFLRWLVIGLDTQKRVPKFIYKQLLNGTHKTVLRILELEGKTDYAERNGKPLLLNYLFLETLSVNLQVDGMFCFSKKL